MNARAIPRAAVRSYLRVLRVPFDAAITLLPGDGSGAKTAARARVDRADASARSILGLVLNDADLRDDAARRHEAVRARQQAAQLRDEAKRKSEQADSRLEDRQEEASKTRQRA